LAQILGSPTNSPQIKKNIFLGFGFSCCDSCTEIQIAMARL
jgi:hypothetical protein